MGWASRSWNPALFGRGLADVADRGSFDRDGGSPLHPVNLGLRMLNWIDRRNWMNEPPGRSTVNLCLKARKREEPPS